MALLNWDETKGNPADYEIAKFRDEISIEAKREYLPTTSKLPEDAGKVKERMQCDLNLKLASTLNVKQVSLLKCYTNDDGLVQWFGEELIDCEKPVSIYFGYPFEKTVHLTVYPLIRIFAPNPHTNESKTRTLDYIGYYIWQIAKCYEDIYRNDWENVSVWGHGFEDLYLERINIHKNNIITLGVGS